LGELVTFHGKTDGSSTEGVFELESDILHGTVSYIRIPKGMKAKIWAKRIGGAACDLIVEYTHDVTAADPWASPTTMELESLSSSGELKIEKRRPIILRGFTGKEAFRVKWKQSTAAESHIALEVEFDELDS